MKAKHLLVLALVTGLVAGSMSIAEAGKKKKKLVPSTSTFFLRHESDDCSDDTTFTLSLTDGEDVDCQYLDNVAWPAFGFIPGAYVAQDGVPFKLDATKTVTGVVSIRSYAHPVGVGAGPASVTVQLLGTVGEEEVTLGEWTTEYTATPGTIHTFEYEIEVDDALNKLVFSSLTANVMPDGTTVGLHGVIEHDEPPALINIPTLIKK